jgi:hypothetical protein
VLWCSGALGSGGGGLVVGEHSRILNLDARRRRHAFLEAEIFTNLSVLSVRFRIQPRKIAIPTSASVLGKPSGFDPSLNFPVLAKTNFASVKPHDRPCDRNRLVFEGYPTETARPAPSQFGFPGSSTVIDIVVTDFLNRLRRNADQFPGSGRGVLQSHFVGPALVMLEGPGAVVVVGVDSASRCIRLLAGRLIVSTGNERF